MKISRKKFLTYSAVSASVVFAGSLLSCKKEEKKEEKPPVASHLRLKNKDNPSELEQKHVPGITAPEKAKAKQQFEISVKLGFAKDHPSTKEHWIRNIRLHVDGKEVARQDFAEGGKPPKAAFKISLEKNARIEAIADCNLHGIWISEPVNITVA